MQARRWLLALAALWLVAVLLTAEAQAQSYGVELRNTLMPASGGMAGTSVARPQDLLSGINANPATLTQFQGTQFIFGGAWAEATMNLEQKGNAVLPGVTPFSAKSHTPGVAVPNVGVTQSFTAYGLPVTVGLGLLSGAGAGTDYRAAPGSNGTSSYLMSLDTAASIGVKLTDKLSAGSTLFIGSGYFDGPFIGTGAMTNAYALRGSVGLSYDWTEATTLGAYYMSSQKFRFDDAVRLQLFDGTFDVTRSIHVEMPTNIGIGIANRSLCDGRLLLALDVLYFDWKSAAFFKNAYVNQWVMQVGSQYQVNEPPKVRLGYAFAQNPIDPDTGDSIDGIPLPGGVPAIKYLQAQLAVINQHRLSAGVGVSNVLPCVDFDAFAGGMFHASEQFGDFTNVSVMSYWLGVGFTWRYGATP